MITQMQWSRFGVTLSTYCCDNID